MDDLKAKDAFKPLSDLVDRYFDSVVADIFRLFPKGIDDLVFAKYPLFSQCQIGKDIKGLAVKRNDLFVKLDLLVGDIDDELVDVDLRAKEMSHIGEYSCSNQIRMFTMLGDHVIDTECEELRLSFYIVGKNDDLGLTPEQKRLLKRFPYSFFEPVVWVHVEFKSEHNAGVIEFEYDLKTKRASHFVYDI